MGSVDVDPGSVEVRRGSLDCVVVPLPDEVAVGAVEGSRSGGCEAGLLVPTGSFCEGLPLAFVEGAEPDVNFAAKVGRA